MSCTRNLFGGSENMIFVNSTTFQIKAKRNWTSFLWNRSGLVGEWARGESDQLSEFLNTFALNGDDIKIDLESKEKFEFFILKFNSRKLFMQNDFARKSIWGKAHSRSVSRHQSASSLLFMRRAPRNAWGWQWEIMKLTATCARENQTISRRSIECERTRGKNFSQTDLVSHSTTEILSMFHVHCRMSKYCFVFEVEGE